MKAISDRYEISVKCRRDGGSYYHLASEHGCMYPSEASFIKSQVWWVQGETKSYFALNIRPYSNAIW